MANATYQFHNGQMQNVSFTYCKNKSKKFFEVAKGLRVCLVECNQEEQKEVKSDDGKRKTTVNFASAVSA